MDRLTTRSGKEAELRQPGKVGRHAPRHQGAVAMCRRLPFNAGMGPAFPASASACRYFFSSAPCMIDLLIGAE